MKAVNFLLAIVTSLLIAALVLEGGLRLLGMGPPPSLNTFDADTGWGKKKGVTITRGHPDGHSVTFALNRQGLRDDGDLEPTKPAGTFRVVALGDSFTLGFGVSRDDLFVDLLENWWNAEGRNVQVVNTGTEAYSTDQEVAWLLANGDEWKPDLVVIFPYENDIYWNVEQQYTGLDKPRFSAEGQLEDRTLENHFPSGLANSALGRMFGSKSKGVARFQPGTKEIAREHGVLLNDPPEWMAEPEARMAGAFRALRAKCDELGAKVVVAPIPSHSAIDPAHLPSFEERLGLGDVGWSPDRPVALFLAAASAAGIPAVDVREHFRDLQSGGTELYFQNDWHINVEGNREFAAFLHDELDALGVLPTVQTVAGLPAPTSDDAGGGMPGWLPWYLGLWGVLGTMYAVVYKKDENPLLGFLKVGVLLAAVFTIAVGGTTLIGMAPPALSRLALLLVVIVIIGFILWKLGERITTITELFTAFMGRGHWYLMPLVTILLTIGSLLVVAASSPLVAPFIYTLF